MAERSRAYPGVALDDCIENARKIRRGLGTGEYDRSAIAKAMGMATATAIRPTAALCHFGMLSRRGKKYSLTELGKALIDPLEGEFDRLARQAVESPSLYAELLDRFRSEGRVPQQLSTVLHRQYEITDKASDLAADVFLQSLQFANLVDSNYNFVRTESPATRVEVTAKDEPESESSETRISGRFSDDSQHFRFRLTGGGFAELLVPAVLKMHDIQIIRKQIDMLEAQIEEKVVE